MLKLQFKLILYNAITKGAIVLILGIILLFFIDDISYNQIDSRLEAKSENFIKNLSLNEIAEKLKDDNGFTDYNILKEEYITLKALNSVNITRTSFDTKNKEVADHTQPYRAINRIFKYENKYYDVEIGISLVSAKRLKGTILYVIAFAVLISLGISLILDTIFNKILFTPFYKIIEQKITKVNDPLSYNHELVKTSTQDFRSLDESLGSLMNKITDLILKEKQFIANVSHELLTPISILTIRLENMLNDEGLNDNQSQKIYNSIKTLLRLKSVVNSLLLISKIENQQFDKPDKIELKTLIKEVVNELEDRIDDKEIAIINEIKNNFGISGHQSLIHTFFFNIINNAVKYNHQNGKIILKDKTSNEFYNLYIIDTGIGIETDKIDSVFKRFEQLDRDVADSHGLGLAIVKSIADFHNIELEIQSEINQGCTFILRFPLTKLS